MKKKRLKIETITILGVPMKKIKGNLFLNSEKDLDQYKIEVLENYICKHNNKNPLDIIPFYPDNAHTDVCIIYKIVDDVRPVEKVELEPEKVVSAV